MIRVLVAGAGGFTGHHLFVSSGTRLSSQSSGFPAALEQVTVRTQLTSTTAHLGRLGNTIYRSACRNSDKRACIQCGLDYAAWYEENVLVPNGNIAGLAAK
jgi:hypothetical protein